MYTFLCYYQTSEVITSIHNKYATESFLTHCKLIKLSIHKIHALYNRLYSCYVCCYLLDSNRVVRRTAGSFIRDDYRARE